MFVAKLMDGENEVPNIEFTYTVNNEAFTGATTAGSYTVLVTYNSVTYGTGSHSFTMVINKANIDLSGVVFEDSTVTYDGAEHELVSVSELPAGVTAFNYTTNKLTSVGSVIATLSFTYDSDNYNAPESMTATLTVSQKALEASMFESIPTQSYTGSALTPALVGSYNNMNLVLDQDFTAVYANNTEKGQASITVTGMNNYSGELTINFTIADSDLDVVSAAKAKLYLEYSTDLNNYTSFPNELTVNGQEVELYWMSQSTALTFVNEQAVTIQGASDNTVKVTVLIIKNNSAEYATFEYTVVAAGETQEDIVNAAYELASGTDLPEEKTLTGVITSIHTAYNSQYSNVSVVIVVGSLTEKPILCYRAVGESAELLAVGDTITVTGTLTNYNGTIEFKAGCTIDVHTPKVWTDDEKVAFDKAELSLPTETTGNLTLPTEGEKGSTITWSSNNTSVIANDGTVTRPVAGEADVDVILTVNITNGTAKDTATFTVTVKAIPAAGSTPDPITITISEYTAGTQYAENEEHVIGETGVKLYTTQCHFTTDLRIYSSSTHDGYFTSNELAGNIKSITFNAGNNIDKLAVYGSIDGSNWIKVTEVATAKAYADVIANFGDSDNYKYFKVDVVGTLQVRIKTITIEFK